MLFYVVAFLGDCVERRVVMHEAFLVLTFLPHLKKVPSDRLHALIGGRRQIVEVADAMFLGLCLPKTSSAGFAVEKRIGP